MLCVLFVPYFRWLNVEAKLYDDPNFDNDSLLVAYPNRIETAMFEVHDVDASIWGTDTETSKIPLSQSMVAPVKISIKVTEQAALLPYKAGIVRAFVEGESGPVELIDFRNESIIAFYDDRLREYQAVRAWGDVV